MPNNAFSTKPGQLEESFRRLAGCGTVPTGPGRLTALSHSAFIPA